MPSFSIGERLKKIMKDKNLTQQVLSQLATLNQSHISGILNDNIDPGVKKLKAIADVLDVDLHWLITGNSYTQQRQLKSVQNMLDPEDTKANEKHMEMIREYIELNHKHQEQVDEIVKGLKRLEEK